MIAMDPLSEVLSLTSAHGSHFAGFRSGGLWAIAFPPPEGLKFNAVVEGSCLLLLEGFATPFSLKAGDCFLLTQPRSFRLFSDIDAAPVTAQDVFRKTNGGIARYGTACDVFMIGGSFSFSDEAKHLLDGLPPVLFVDGNTEHAGVLRWALQRLAHEMSGHLPGSALMAQHLGHMMLVQVLRLYSATAAYPSADWLHALNDPRLSAAISAVHANPAHKWTVSELAAKAGISRSSFAFHFRNKVDMSPLAYVTNWRIQLACRALRLEDRTISSIAQKLGYESDSAFSATFKRLKKISPKEYRGRYRPLAHGVRE